MLSIQRYEAPDEYHQYRSLDEVPADMMSITELGEAASVQPEEVTLRAVESMAAYIRSYDSYVVRAEDTDDITTLAVYTRLNRMRHAPSNTSWLNALATRESMRGRGIGAYMIEYLVGVAKQDGIDAIGLCAKDQPRVIRFYERNGFKIKGTVGKQKLPLMQRTL